MHDQSKDTIHDEMVQINTIEQLAGLGDSVSSTLEKHWEKQASTAKKSGEQDDPAQPLSHECNQLLSFTAPIKTQPLLAEELQAICTKDAVVREKAYQAQMEEYLNSEQYQKNVAHDRAWDPGLSSHSRRPR